MVALIPVLVAIAGALLYGLSGTPKPIEIGKIMFACGLLVALLAVSGHTVRLF